MTGLDGKVALVTGGSRGIGAAVATRLARDGATVALTYVAARDQADTVVARIGEAGGRALAIQADSSDPEAVTAAVDRTAETFGSLDILVNSAGIFDTGLIDDLTVERIDRTLAIHVRAVLVGARAAVRHLPRGGRIISIGSNLGERALFPGLSLYAASKSALDGLTRGLARDLGERGITATVVHPGSTDTDMNPADGPDATPQLAHIALGHYGAAEDIAGTVAFLAGEGGRKLTGTAITVDGGTNA